MNLEKIFKISDKKLKSALRYELVKLGYKEGALHNKATFLYAEGNAPYMLVAHLDTVHKELPSVICYSKDGDIMMSPNGIGGDDRCGVYIILSLLEKLPFKPYVLFTMGEEIGCVGASDFSGYIEDNIPELKYIVEYDRKGNTDCVFYSLDNDEFVEFVEQFGFKKEYGSFSDISVIAPTLGVAAVNLSSGYYNPHTTHEYVSIKDMENIIQKSIRMLNANCEKFEYVEKVYTTYSYGKYGWGGDYDGYYGKYESDVEMLVSVVPENTLYLYDYLSDDWHKNGPKEVVVDKDGNVYRYCDAYKDYISMASIHTVHAGFVPTYDETNTQTVMVYSVY